MRCTGSSSFGGSPLRSSRPAVVGQWLVVAPRIFPSRHAPTVSFRIQETRYDLAWSRHCSHKGITRVGDTLRPIARSIHACKSTFGAANPVPKLHGTLCGTESLVIVGDLCNLWTAARGPLEFAAVLKVLPNNHLPILSFRCYRNQPINS